jgi:hypothetical protein
MAKGGFTEIGSIHYDNEEVPEKLRKGVTLKEMREVLSQNFPYSFTFKLYELKDKTTSSPDYDKDEIKDGSIGKIKFPNYKSARGINYKISQGGENTYFDFLLEEVNTSKAVVGTFGFKDGGDVDSSYITRFIVFLMECYGLPFSIEHSVYAKGGYMAKGGIIRNGDELTHYEPYFEKNVRVASIDEDNKIIRPSMGYFYPNKIAKKTILWAKNNGYKFIQDGKEYAKGGETPFEKLSDKVAKNYQGDKVPKKYQSLYGKTYDKSEAKEVGDKVAAKVYRLQLKNKKMKSGGEILYTEKHRKD